MPIDKDLQEIIDVLADGAIAVEVAFKDGFQYGDIIILLPVFSQIPEAIKDANNALNYLKDMTPAKEEEIILAVMVKIPNASVKTKQLVTFILRTLINAYMIFAVLSSNQEGTSPTGLPGGANNPK